MNILLIFLLFVASQARTKIGSEKKSKHFLLSLREKDGGKKATADNLWMPGKSNHHLLTHCDPEGGKGVLSNHSVANH